MWLIVFSAAARLNIEFEIYPSIWCRNKGVFTKGIFRVFIVTEIYQYIIVGRMKQRQPGFLEKESECQGIADIVGFVLLFFFH